VSGSGILCRFGFAFWRKGGGRGLEWIGMKGEAIQGFRG